VTPDVGRSIGADPETRGCGFATGHGRNGILLAALTGDVIGDLLTGGATASTSPASSRAPADARYLTADVRTAPSATLLSTATGAPPGLAFGRRLGVR